MSRLTEIISGWTNWGLDQFDLLDEDIKELGTKRLEVCNTCPVRTQGLCDAGKEGEVVQDFYYIRDKQDRVKGEIVHGCSCPLEKKAVSPLSQCPRGCWENIKIKEK